jgi:hypothetical protein
MVVQLAAVGLVLKLVFAQSSPLWTLAIAVVMVAVAGWEVSQRQERRFAGRWWSYGLGNATLLLAGGLATLYAVVLVIGPEPWYAPRYVLPILGMVLGSTLTSVSLALQTLTEGAERERAAIEARLALGATRLEAFSDVLRRAMRTAVTPLVNQMSVAGIVTLPGMMTGRRRPRRGRQVPDHDHARADGRGGPRGAGGGAGRRPHVERWPAPVAAGSAGIRSARLPIAAHSAASGDARLSRGAGAAMVGPSNRARSPFRGANPCSTRPRQPFPSTPESSTSRWRRRGSTC